MSDRSPIPSRPGEVPGDPSHEAPVSLEPQAGTARPDSKPLSAALERIGANSPKSGRYRLDGEIARGGMGVIQKVWDANLRRAIARKLLGKGPSGSDSRQSDPRSVGRFLEEAQVTAQLEHPGIVPVHELGLDAEGKLYFTMRLVRGEDLHKIFEHVKTGAHGWNLTRALHVMLRVCEAMSYAHKKGVLHRDLKPANVMVGRFGEVYVMDWGLARVLGEHDTKNVRIAPDPQSSDVHTDRGSVDVDTPDSPLLTMDGDVVGTPAYMSPEQARGEIEALGPASDVYSLGAMLYHLLAGHMPYVEPGTKPSARAIWHRVMVSPPPPLGPPLPAELVAIVDKAMTREPRGRYGSVLELADDLRAYLELRVVRAHRTGALVELSKWVQRNRLAAVSLTGVLLATLTAGILVTEARERLLSEQSRELRDREATALLEEAEELWPIDPALLPRLDGWLTRARDLANERVRAEQELADFREKNAKEARIPRVDVERAAWTDKLEFSSSRKAAYESFLALLTDDRVPADVKPEVIDNELRFADLNRSALKLEIPRLSRFIAELEQRLAAPPLWRFADLSLEFEHARLARRAFDLQRLAGSGEGSMADVERRRSASTSIVNSARENAELWRVTCAALAEAARFPIYGGLRIAPQTGLVPVGPDPTSGLMEFWHVLSGERPERDPSGRFRITPATGIVLILVPGGRVLMGSQDRSPDDPNYFIRETDIGSELGPVARWTADVQLAPYFLAKYELTQAQWLRMGGEDVSTYPGGVGYMGFPRVTRTHPVESVRWEDVAEILARHGLELPTEAQWEHAARARTQLKYSRSATWTGSIAGVNFADDTAHAHRWIETPCGRDDGWPMHCPVDALEPDSWGFYHLVGNVEEWCRDWYASSCERGNLREGDGEHVPKSSSTRAVRGASFRSAPRDLWISQRYGRPQVFSDMDLGVRPCRTLVYAP